MKRADVDKVLIIGSGPIVIGQAEPAGIGYLAAAERIGEFELPGQH